MSTVEEVANLPRKLHFWRCSRMGESSVIDNLQRMMIWRGYSTMPRTAPNVLLVSTLKLKVEKKLSFLSSALMNTGVSPCPRLLPFFALLNHHLRAITSSYTTGTWEMCFEFQNPLPVTVYSNRDRNFQWPCVTVYHCPNESSRSWFWKWHIPETVFEIPVSYSAKDSAAHEGPCPLARSVGRFEQCY